MSLSTVALGGTGSAWSGIIVSIIVVFNALVLGELAARYPVSGGLYSYIKYLLPAPIAMIAVCLTLLQAVTFTPGIALGIGTYVQLLFPQIPQTPLMTSIISAIVLVFAVALAIKDIGTSSKVSLVLLAIQGVIVCIYIGANFLQPQRSMGEILTNPVVLDGTGTLVPVGIGTILLAAGSCQGVINGYDASLGFAEETKGRSINVAKAVIISAVCACAFILVPIISSMIAAPDIAEYLRAPSPYLYTANATLGSFGSVIISLGIIVASFIGLVALNAYMARVLYTTGRDELWGNSINRFITKVSPKSRSPWVASLIIAVVSMVLIFASSLVDLITFVGVLVALVYVLIAVGVFLDRKKDPDGYRPFKMPLYPLPAIVVIISLTAVICMQNLRDIGLSAVVCIIALAYYFIFIRPKKKRKTK
ncbi:APC family permease [Clostridium sp. AM58-1XD]|nr:APC family permease [Clostridium sp. AM58-1XD]